jgi:hypothetical protein
VSKREEYLDVVDRRRADRVLFAPLADGLFAASVAGTPWVSDTGLDEQIAAAEICGYHATFVQGSSPDLSVNPALEVETRRVADSPDERRFEQTIRTPKGDLARTLVERPGEGITAAGDWIGGPEGLDAADWISEDILAGRRDARIRDRYADIAVRLRPHGVTQIQLELPYFLYALAGFAEKPLMMHLTARGRFARSMDLAEQALGRIARLLVEAGIDFIWVGAPGTELLSPAVWEEVVIPQSRRMVERVRDAGGRVHFHCCGRSNTWIEKGYYDRIGMDLVETLSPPPAGDVEDLARARAAIGRGIVTRGNIDLELIRTAAPDACATAARDVIEATREHPHVVGAADALLYGTPVENVRAIQAACAEANLASP